jgi:alpha-D-xyloside xylohydrolase
VYLPATAGGWYDFWTGTAIAGRQTTSAAAPYDSLPLYVRAGSIIPTGPELEYVDQQPADPITLYVYAGADAAFTLYEDDGESYAYEGGAFSRIPLGWDDATSTLSIGAREGSFSGMLSSRTFRIILVNPSRTVGFTFTPGADEIVTYDGTAVSVMF